MIMRKIKCKEIEKSARAYKRRSFSDTEDESQKAQ